MNSRTLSRLTKDSLISKTKFVHHVLRTTPILSRDGNFRRIRMVKNEVIMLPSGGQVLPYFEDSEKKWKIVLVSQYRPAIKNMTVEGAGGILDGKAPQKALARELKEETGVRVNPRSIKIVLNEYAHPSILSASVFGGIVEIKAHMVTDKKIAGKKSENERTRVEICDFLHMLKEREKGLTKVDLLTSRLLDEVAKATGLLVKKY